MSWQQFCSAGWLVPAGQAASWACAMAQLTGTGRMADDLYLLAHDDVTGKPFLQPRALGVGLAGALLAELMLAGAILVQAAQIQITAQGVLPDGLGRRVLDVLLVEPDRHPVRDWLMYLAASAAQDVGMRLEYDGYLTRVSSRRPWRSTKLVPADPDAAFAPLVRVRTVLDPARSATASDALLTGLAIACGLGSRVLPFGPPGARGILHDAIRHLHPGLRELIASTQAAVDSALLSHRV